MFLLSSVLRSVTGDSGHPKPSVSELGLEPDARGLNLGPVASEASRISE